LPAGLTVIRRLLTGPETLILQEDRESSSSSAPARTHKDRKHGPLSGIEVDDALAVAEQIDV
jgi:hypothetical protein